MTYNTGSLGLPIVLLVSLWGAVNTTLKFFEIINKRRDEVFGLIDSCGGCPEITLGPLSIYFANVVPMTLGVCLFLVLICYVIISIPRYMNVDDGEDIRRMETACKLIATLPGFGLLAFIVGGMFDAILLFRSF